jgi:hypothetical protein
MDAPLFASATLPQESHHSSHRRHRDVASQSPSPNATGTNMENNTIERDSAGAQEPPQRRTGTREVASDLGGSQDSYNSTNLAQQAASSYNSQSAAEGHDAISKPPTSSSDGPSSQGTNQEGQISQLSQLSHLAAAQQPMVENPASQPDPVTTSTAGHKRTADGQVKPSSPPSPNGPRNRGHSRNTSAVSNISTSTTGRIGEVNNDSRPPNVDTNLSAQLSSELRTRLSYAMVKVNNGWQSNTIEEVESLASQTGSPTSSTSTLQGRRNFAASPRAAMIAIQGQTRSPKPQAIVGDFDLFSRSEPSSRTYESFWRDHSTSAPSHRPYVTSPPTTKGSLGPPADIRPTTSPRRSHTPKFSKPPAIPSHSSDPTPRTPTQTNLREKRIQTPSQKTIQEQDAIETLLFMSSPGNSGNMGHGPFGAPRPLPQLGSPQRSPLRAEFRIQDRRGTQGRRVEFEKLVTGDPSSEAKRSSRSSILDETREDTIDRLLDRMSDVSSDEDEVVLTYEPRVAGRV